MAADGDEADETSSYAPTRIVIVERNAFLRDCLHRAILTLWPVESATCANLAEVAQVCPESRSTVVLLSIVSLSEREADEHLTQLMELGPSIRSMVLARTDDFKDALNALSQGANGYISMSVGFEVFIQALRFVGAGGNYVPTQCLLSANQAPAAAPEQALANGVTSREMRVIQAIRQGKPNKVIAYELNICESTVKVHVRHVMKKLQARNRTEVAIKGADLALPARQTLDPMAMSLFPSENQSAPREQGKPPANSARFA